MQTRAELSIVRSQLVELGARRARLMAERDGLARHRHSADELGLSSRHADLVIAMARCGCSTATAPTAKARRSSCSFEIAQLGEEIKGLQAQQVAKNDELELVEVEHSK